MLTSSGVLDVLRASDVIDAINTLPVEVRRLVFKAFREAMPDHYWFTNPEGQIDIARGSYAEAWRL